MVRLRLRPRAHRKGRSTEQWKSGQTPPETRAHRKGRSTEQPARASAARDSRPHARTDEERKESRRQPQPQTPHARSASIASEASDSRSRPWRHSQQRLASLAPRLSSHAGRQRNAAASRSEWHDRPFARFALPQPIKASSGYGRPVGRADFKFWP